jgi:hypothetical protein
MSLSLSPQKRYLPTLYRYLDTNGDGTGTKLAIGNYAVPTDFKIVPTSGQTLLIERMIVNIRDNGVLTADGYGAGAALTNGVSIAVKDSGGVVQDITDGIKVKLNAQWGRQNYDIKATDFGAGDNFVLDRWSFFKAGDPLVVDGRLGQYFAVTLNDDFSFLVDHTFYVNAKVLRDV